MRDGVHPASRSPARPSRIGRRTRPGGFVLIYATVMIVVLLGLASLAVDWGRTQLLKTELQRSADAAALAAIPNLGNSATVYGEAQSLAALNPADGAPVELRGAADVEIGVWNAASRAFDVASNPNAPANNAVRVTARRTRARGNALELPFGSVIGMPRTDVSAVSIATTGGKSFDYSGGFNATSNVSLNGVAALKGTAIRLTGMASNQVGTAWHQTQMPIAKFSTTFDFWLAEAKGDGFTFVIQNKSTTAIGIGNYQLGYGGTNVRPSVAVKFDLYNNGYGETNSCTGIYLNGAVPAAAGSYDMLPTIDLRSGHPMRARFDYDGATLTQVVTDLTTNSVYTRNYPIDIPATLGARTAWVGFTASTGGASAVQMIKSWTFTAPGNAMLGR